MHTGAAEISVGTKLGHYEIIRLIGSGGMGRVYLARDSILKRNVAIKLITSAETPTSKNNERFLREACAAAALDHQNICSIFEIGEDKGSNFIVLQYIDGQTLAERLNSGPLTPRDALEIAANVAEALVAAHARGIIHRDIKPDNIMLTRTGQVKVMDFGLAKVAERTIGGEDETQQQLTSSGMILGTIGYMSPEQARGETLDERSDIFSLGVVLYEMITGRKPFEAGSRADVLAAILTREPPPLANYCRDASPELQSLVSRMLAKNREDRYPSMERVLRDTRILRERLRSTSTLEFNTERLPKVPSRAPRKTIAFPIAVAGLLLTALILAAAYIYYSRRTSSTAPSTVRSLTVLPLRSLDGGDNYLGLGIADAVIRRISQTGELIVRPTSAVRRYSAEDTDALTAARELGTDAILEGSVQRAGDRLRISVNLLRTADGSSLWAENFDMRMTDVFVIQDQISQQVVDRLQLKLDPAQKERFAKQYTSSPAAYEFYVKGQAHLEQRSTAVGDTQPMLSAEKNFAKAIELDPNYALAHAALGYTYMWMANFNDPDNPLWVEKSKQALATAESLDPQLAEIHVARSEYYFSKYGGWDLERSAAEARQAQALNPSVGHQEIGRIYDHLGLDERVGLGEIQKELEIDPTNEFSQRRLVECYELYGRFDDAIETHTRLFGPPGPPFSLIGKGRLDDAESVLKGMLTKSPGDLRAQAMRLVVVALRGRFQEAEAAIPELVHKVRNNRSYHHITYDVARVYALAGKSGEAVKWLRATSETGMPNYPLFERDAYLDRVRQSPEFVAFMQELRLRWEDYKSRFE